MIFNKTKQKVFLIYAFRKASLHQVTTHTIFSVLLHQNKTTRIEIKKIKFKNRIGNMTRIQAFKIGFLIIFYFLSLNLFGQIRTNEGLNNICYAKCLIDTTSIEIIGEYPLYTGENFDSEFIQEIEIEVKSAHGKWEKRRKENCYSVNIDDCSVLCFIQYPAKIIEIVVVTDTNETKEFVIETVIKEKIEDEGIFEEREVICEKNVTPKFIKLLKEALEVWGYEVGLTDRYEIGKRTKNALTQFQRDNELPIGQLDFETLDLLGVEY